MSNQHTPFATDGPDFDDRIIDANGERIAEVVFGDYIERVYIARRIVACVNACAGLPTPTVEGLSCLLSKLEFTEQQRDELQSKLDEMANTDLFIDFLERRRLEKENEKLIDAIKFVRMYIVGEALPTKDQALKTIDKAIAAHMGQLS